MFPSSTIDIFVYNKDEIMEGESKKRRYTSNQIDKRA